MSLVDDNLILSVLLVATIWTCFIVLVGALLADVSRLLRDVEEEEPVGRSE